VEPTRWSRQWSVWAAKWWTWNYGRDLQGDGINSQAYWQFLNYWNVNANVGWARRVLDDRLTRGGPSATLPAGGFWNLNVNSDSRRKVAFYWNANASRSEAGDYSRNSSIGLTIKPLSRVLVNVNPSWNRRHALAQYVRTVVDPSADATFGSRYVFGALDQRQLSIPTRVSLILTPRVSFRLYMQPLLATGTYGDFKELARPRTFDFLHYGQGSSTLDYNPESRIYTADPDGSGDASSFDFANPDFNLKSLRVNTVFRWEIKPGSAFYAVWTRQQQDLSDPGHFVPGHDLRVVFGAPGDDVVLFKFAYWLGR
jgi:hypothetical protein